MNLCLVYIDAADTCSQATFTFGRGSSYLRQYDIKVPTKNVHKATLYSIKILVKVKIDQSRLGLSGSLFVTNPT